MELELDDLLEKGIQQFSWRCHANVVVFKLEETNEQLSALSNKPETLSASMLLHDTKPWRELKRTKASVKSALDHANLLSGVRNDIEYIHLA
ncbi:hypothetical protein B0H14DRAFT_2677114 [Mycena olivaceomarginata]|nr:hypothetical protein B0H14DRAFT_2677114 [Mycena olivaceomarginata]